MKTKFSIFWLKVLLISILFLFTGCKGIKNQKAKEGILDLTNWDFIDHGITNLNGEWEFYWNQLIDPKDTVDNNEPSYAVLPGVWNDFKNLNETYSGEGYATFRLNIKSNIENEKLGLRIPYHFTSYKLWVNGKLLAVNGVVGKSKNQAVPQTLPKYVYFYAPEGDIKITLQVSNFHFDKGGAPAPYKIGLENQIRSLQTRLIALDLFLAGILFIMAFHHLGLYYLLPKEVYTLYFSLVCFFVLIRTIGLSETFLIELFPSFDFEIYIKLLFLGYFIVPPLFILFTQRLFPLDSNHIVGKIFMILGFLFSITLLFPSSVSTKVIMPYAVILIVSYFYLLRIVIKACIRKREGSSVALIGISIIVVAVFNDLLYEHQMIITGYYGPYGVAVFIFSQSFLLSLKFSNAYKAIQRLTRNIKRINVANSRFVPTEFLSFLGKKSIVEVKLGDHVTKEMTVLFADVRSFTSISERLTPEENFHFINSLLRRLGPIVRKNNGFIDKYIGDSIMALFPRNPLDAIFTAADVLKELEHFNVAHTKKGFIPIRLGIGINSGKLMLGTIGEKQRMDGTVISDSVNIASRLEGLSKLFDANIIVSEKVLQEVNEKIDLHYRFLGKISVKGKMKSVPIYEIFSYDLNSTKALKLKIKELFEKAIRLYEDKLYQEAKNLFESALEIFPNDRASLYYLDLIKTKEL